MLSCSMQQLIKVDFSFEPSYGGHWIVPNNISHPSSLAAAIASAIVFPLSSAPFCHAIFFSHRKGMIEKRLFAGYCH